MGIFRRKQAEPLRSRIANDLNAAMSAGDVRALALGFLMEEIERKEVVRGILSDDEVIKIIAFECRRRHRAIEASRSGRSTREEKHDVADAMELAVFMDYLPDELGELVEQLRQVQGGEIPKTKPPKRPLP